MDRLSVPSAAVIAIDHQVEPTWMTPISKYLKNGALPENRAKAIKVRVRTIRYSLINDLMYRWSFSSPYSRCILRGEAEKIIEQVH